MQKGPLSFLRLNNSPRLPSFAGPITLAAALLAVSIFSTPFWHNFYVIRANSADVEMKVGMFGVCNRLRNTTGYYGPSEWCTSKQTGFNLNFVLNSTGINQFPISDTTSLPESILFGTVAGADSVSILTSGQTSLFWLHIISAIIALSTVLSLLCPPRYLGSPQSRLFAFQKSGILTILLALTSCLMAFIAFFVYLGVLLPAKNRLDDIDGISAAMGNVPWYVLPCGILHLPAIISVLMRSSKNEYADL